jgi:XisH protein
VVPRRDKYHQAVVDALIADGWTITHDPMSLGYGTTDMYVDLGAELPLAAEKDHRKIAVEIKSFVSASEVHDLQNALGQYIIYRDILLETEPDRSMYLAVPRRAYGSVFSTLLGRLVIRKHDLNLLVYDVTGGRIVQWLP